MTRIDIQRLEPNDASGAARWDAFVQSCPQASFFHRAGWQRIIKQVFRHDTYYFQAQVDGRIEGCCRWRTSAACSSATRW